MRILAGTLRCSARKKLQRGKRRVSARLNACLAWHVRAVCHVMYAFARRAAPFHAFEQAAEQIQRCLPTLEAEYPSCGLAARFREKNQSHGACHAYALHSHPAQLCSLIRRVCISM
jgi:hypothetical protein